MKKIEKIRNLVKKEFDQTDYEYHILPVVNYAKKLAKIYKVNLETAELAALLHDIGRVKLKDDKKHHIIGAKKAEKILKKHNYPINTIREIKHCVLSHRTSAGPKPKTIIAKIVANADAMSHFDGLPVFFYWRGIERKKFNDIVEWVDKKLAKDWNKKLTLPPAKKMVREKYQAIKLLLKSVKEN